jgi:Uma2 family endonuclease
MNAFEVWTEPRPVRLNAGSFWQLAKAGAFQNHNKTELIDGVVVSMSPQHSRHAFLQSEFHLRLALSVREIRPDLRTAVEASIAVSPEDVPQADILVSSYRGRPAPIPVSTVPLVVEIADTTASYDRGKKTRIYASGRIPNTG